MKKEGLGRDRWIQSRAGKQRESLRAKATLTGGLLTRSHPPQSPSLSKKQCGYYFALGEDWPRGCPKSWRARFYRKVL